MMRSDPHPSSTAENSRFSMMADIAIHQRLLNAEARVGAMFGGRKSAEQNDRSPNHTQTHAQRERERARERGRARTREGGSGSPEAQAVGSLICKEKSRGRVSFQLYQDVT